MNLTTDDADGKIRLDQYLAAHLPELSRSRIQSLIKSGDVLVNGSPAKPKNPVSRGDSITVRIPEPEPAEAQPQDIPLDILYEDEDVVVINKESGMVVHPAAGNPDGTIVNALLHHCGDLSGIGGVERPGIVHRLDKDTSGCLVIAKNDGAHQSLTAQFAARSTEKRYLAVVQGIPSQSSGTVFTHIGRHPVNRREMAGRFSSVPRLPVPGAAPGWPRKARWGRAGATACIPAGRALRNPCAFPCAGGRSPAATRGA